MTRSKLKRDRDEAERAMIATDRAVKYLDENHGDHAAEIAMRVLYRLALIWQIESKCRRIQDPHDPRLVFNICDEDVRRVHNEAAALPAASQSDALAEHHVMTLLSEFGPDRAWWTAHNIAKRSGSLPTPLIR
jgi:hypothetical protein